MEHMHDSVIIVWDLVWCGAGILFVCSILATGRCMGSRPVNLQLQPYHCADVRQACVDGVGVGDIVQDLLLPVLFVMSRFSLLAPVLSHSRVLKRHTPAAKRHGQATGRRSA